MSLTLRRASIFRTTRVSGTEAAMRKRDVKKQTRKTRLIFCGRNVSRRLVPMTGLEPVRSRPRGILSPLCLPVPPHRHAFDIYIFYHIEFPLAILLKVNGLQIADRFSFIPYYVYLLPPSIVFTLCSIGDHSTLRVSAEIATGTYNSEYIGRINTACTFLKNFIFTRLRSTNNSTVVSR